MVRTRAESSARKAVAAKAPRKQVGSSSGAGSSSRTPSKKGSYSSGGGGNPLRVCDIPAWQKGISEFYPKLKTKKKSDNIDGDDDMPCSKASAECEKQPRSSCADDSEIKMDCDKEQKGIDSKEQKDPNVPTEESNRNETNEDDDNEVQGSSKLENVGTDDDGRQPGCSS